MCQSISCLGLNKLDAQWMTSLVLVLALALILALEYATPSGFVFGYLYTGPIVLTFSRFSRQTGFLVTAFACAATLLNSWLPQIEPLEGTTVANRGIAVLALVVTGWLSERNRGYEEVLRASEAQLATQTQLVRVREDFIATLTHDLRTPILGAVATLGHLREDFDQLPPKHLKRALDVLDRGSRSQLQLIENLLQIYRADNTGLSLNRTLFNLAALVNTTVAALQDLANRRAIRLVCVGLAEAPFEGDAVQLQRVLSNLLINSLNHTPRGGCVTVALADVPAAQQFRPQAPPLSWPARYQLAVSDTGSGIQPEDLSHLFERFYQGQGERQLPGTGLGLYLARQIVEAHGGQIQVENRSTGGVIFTVELPHDAKRSGAVG